MTEENKGDEKPMVLVPVEVFGEIVRVLSGLPYAQIGPLMNTLSSYKVQNVRQADAPEAPEADRDRGA